MRNLYTSVKMPPKIDPDKYDPSKDDNLDQNQKRAARLAKSNLYKQQGFLAAVHSDMKEALEPYMDEDSTVGFGDVGENFIKDKLAEMLTETNTTRALLRKYGQCGIPDEVMDSVGREIDNQLDRIAKTRSYALATLARMQQWREDKRKPRAIRTGDGNDLPKVQSTFKPNKLNSDCTLLEFKRWREQYSTYYELSGFEQYPIHAVHTTFFTLLDPDLEKKIRARAHEDTPVLGDGSLMERLEEVITAQNPIQVRRHELFSTKQKSHQKFSDTIATIETLAAAADIATITAERLITYVCIGACTDSALRKEILREATEPTMPDIRRITAAYEAESATSKCIDKRHGGSQAHFSSKKKQQERGRSKSKHRGKSKARTASKGPIKCLRCNETGHIVKNCKMSRSSVKCDSCGKTGHISAACLGKRGRPQSRGRSMSRRGRTPSPSPNRIGFKGVNANYIAKSYSVSRVFDEKDAEATISDPRERKREREEREIKKDKPREEKSKSREEKKKDGPKEKEAIEEDKKIYAKANLTRECPRVEVEFVGKSCEKGVDTTTLTHEVIPDTGATDTCIKRSLIIQAGIKYDKADQATLRVADGNQLRVVGTCKLIASYQGTTAAIKALVVAGLEPDILLGWQDMKHLKMIHDDFPARVNSTSSEATAATDKMSESAATVHPPLSPGCVPLFISNPNSRDFEGLRNKILEDFADVFRENLVDCPPIKNGKMVINVEPNAIPFKVCTARPTPIHMREAGDKLIKKMLEAKIIRQLGPNETSEWCSRGFFVPKGDSNEVRLVNDMTALNKYCIRAPKPFPSTKEILANLNAEDRFFAKLDLVAGYHQLELDPASRKYTTFILDSARYEYLRSPMGCNLTMDAFCDATDLVFQGREGVQKMVDDGLVGAIDLLQLEFRLRRLLMACRDNNIILSKKKFVISNRVKFAGHILGEGGIEPNPDKVKAIVDFPAPKNVTDVRSFMGLVNQLGAFLPDLSQMAIPIQELTKKNVPFLWTVEQEAAFQQLKRIITSNLVVQPFHMDSSRFKTVLYTDASTLGLGYLLVQEELTNAGQVRDHRLIRCGSRSLISAEKNYAPTELECLAVFYAVTHCNHFLAGAPKVEVRTDHRSLLGMWKKELGDVPNKRVQRFRERLQQYNLELVYLEGKKNLMADALSRYPLTTQLDINEEIEHAQREEDYRQHVFTCLTQVIELEPNFQAILNSRDDDYLTLLKAVGNKNKSQAPKAYHKKFDELSTLGTNSSDLVFIDSTRVVVPIPFRTTILKALHKGHCGMNKTQQLAQRLVWWPDMNNDINNHIRGCDACRTFAPAQQDQVANREPARDMKEMNPMSDVGVDLFEYGGHDYLVMVDRYSGFPFVAKLHNTSTNSVCYQLKQWFAAEGIPRRIRTDGGPQFRALFQDWCEEAQIIHELAAAYHPESNGLAEAGVKQMKLLLKKCEEEGADMTDALLTWRTTPMKDGPSPSALFRGREMRIRQIPTLPIHEKFYKTSQMEEFEQQRQKLFEQTRAKQDKEGREWEIIPRGTLVDVKNQKGPGWLLRAAIIKFIRDDMRSYVLTDVATERQFVRARRDVRISSESNGSNNNSDVESAESPIVSSPPALNTRSKKKKQAQISFILKPDFGEADFKRDVDWEERAATVKVTQEARTFASELLLGQPRLRSWTVSNPPPSPSPSSSSRAASPTPTRGSSGFPGSNLLAEVLPAYLVINSIPSQQAMPSTSPPRAWRSDSTSTTSSATATAATGTPTTSTPRDTRMTWRRPPPSPESPPRGRRTRDSSSSSDSSGACSTILEDETSSEEETEEKEELSRHSQRHLRQVLRRKGQPGQPGGRGRGRMD